MLLPETLKIHNKTRFEFHYIYFLPWKDQMVGAITEAGGKVTCFPAKNNIQLLFQYRRVIDYCRIHDINLIHCHLPWAGFLGRVVFLHERIPTIYTEHNLQERYHFITRLINRHSFNSQSLALGVSSDVTKSIKENIHPGIPVKTLPNGANTTSFRRDPLSGEEIKKSLGIPLEARVIGNVAVFRFQKRLVEWLQIFKEIFDKNPKVYGIIVGAGPLEKEILEELHRLNLKDRVFFPGLITEVKPYFSAMDIFMMSSSFEGLPIALLEAMSMECAIVSTNAGGIKEVIRNGEDGLICEVQEWPRLAQLCLELLNSSDNLEKMKSAARFRVETSFSLIRMVNDLEDVYDKME